MIGAYKIMKNNNKSVSLKEIAEAAGVSVPTVSRVLRDKGEVSDELRDRVKSIASKLNWRPNRLVQGFQTGKTHLVGVMVRPSNYFFSRIIEAIHEVLVGSNYAPVLMMPGLDGSSPTEAELLERFLEYRVDGILITPHLMNKDDTYLQKVWQERIPLVCMDSHMPRTHSDYVGHDTEHGARLAAKYFLDKGHRRIAHFHGPQYSISVQRRKLGFEQELSAAGVGVLDFADPSFGSDPAYARKFLESRADITAVFTDNDFQAELIYREAFRLGIRIHADLSVIGFADLPLASRLYPALTTVSQDGYALGKRAAGLLLERIESAGASSEPRNITIPVELIERDSVATLT